MSANVGKMRFAPFSVLEPTAEETPVIVEVPHAGLCLDALALASICAPARSIARDADLYVDELYAEAPSRGATLIVSHVSRYVVDLNRSQLDTDPETVEGAPRASRATRGIVWRLAGDGSTILERPVSRRELERRLDGIYHPYHRAIADALHAKRERFGFAIVLAAHSMPSVGRAGPGESPTRRADVVAGTRGRTSAAAPVIDAVDAYVRECRLSIAHDDPYQGGFTTRHYGRPAERVHVIQIELARRLYMSEETLEKVPTFDAVRSFCSELVAALGRSRP